MIGLGVDVGGPRKGFDVAVVDGRTLLGRARGCDVAGVLELARAWVPAAIGIDAPRACAPDGERSRAGERALARAICSIRYTPDAATVTSGGAFYAWVRAGLVLHEACARAFARTPVIEVFPTASWTVWCGPRAGRSRTSWSCTGLATLDLGGVPKRTSQDLRDAIAAAVTARLHAEGRTRAFGDLVVPADGPLASPP